MSADHGEESEILLYADESGTVKVDVLYRDESFWMTQKRLAELFGVGVPAISKHLENIYDTGELQREATVSILETVQQEGGRRVSRKLEYYNLDAIIAVGYRVNSAQATQFRIWATQTLKEFIIKGFVMDDERLKQGEKFGKDYFDELLERIREIRASERRFYQKITDIYAQCSADYDPNSDITQTFYATVQNKLHWAIHSHTAAELIQQRADSDKPHMGLTTWASAPKGKVVKSDTTVAKNYLSQQELDELNHIVVMYLDYAELQAKKQRLMTMAEWMEKLDAFLKFNDYAILENPGKVSAAVARQTAGQAWETFRQRQDAEHRSDFDRLVDKTQSKGKKKS